MAKEKDSKKKKHFLKDFKAELKKVIWPTPKQVVKNTIAVITIVLITAALVFVLDLVFETINKYGTNKLKASIKNKVVVENTIDNTTENVNTEATENTTEDSNTQAETAENSAESTENVQ